MIDIDKYIENEEKLIKHYENLMPSQISIITYHKELLIILDTFKLLCFYMHDQLPYICITEDIKTLIEDTYKKVIERGYDA